MRAHRSCSRRCSMWISGTRREQLRRCATTNCRSIYKYHKYRQICISSVCSSIQIVDAHTRTRTRMHACTHTHAHVYVCTHVGMYVLTHTHTHTHTHSSVHTRAHAHAMPVSRPLRPGLVPVGAELMLRWGRGEGGGSQEGVHES